MEIFSAIGELFLKTFVSVPLNVLFWVVLIIIFTQFRRIAGMEKKLFGRVKTKIPQRLVTSLSFGIIGGFAASLLLFLLGVSLTEIGIIYILPLALLLMLIKMRYLCFAYAGGIIAFLASIIQLFPAVPFFETPVIAGIYHLHVPGLLSLIAVLHFTESVLMRLSGHLHPSPVFVKTPQGKIVGGFSLQSFWPLPLVGLAVAAALQFPVAGETIPMPDWWPLLGTAWSAIDGEELVFLMLPLVAWLGYGDIALSLSPREKVRLSSRNLALYSLGLLFLAFLAAHYPLLCFPAALFSPLGHELVIRIGNKLEFQGNYLYAPPVKGVKVLDTFPSSPAASVFEPGDVILTVASEEVNSIPDFWKAIYHYYPYLYLEIQKPDGRLEKKKLSLPSRDIRNMGVILVPENPPAYTVLKY